MKKSDKKIILISRKPGEIRKVSDMLEGFGWKVFRADNVPRAAEIIGKKKIRAAVISAGFPDLKGPLENLKKDIPGFYTILLAGRTNIQRVMNEYQYLAADFLIKPVHPIHLETLLHRLGHWIDWNKKEKKTAPDVDSMAWELADKRIDTERFLAIRQVVDKMSSFIGQVASDAQGGLRYFNELPYFVSIHDRNYKVLAANAIYYKHLGHRLYHNSWDIYVGKRATRNGCPVGLAIKSGSVMITNALVKYKSGAKVPVKVHTAPIFDNEGEIEFVLEVFAGTKEIDHMAQEIRTTQQRYHLLFDAVPNHIAVLDRRFNLTAVNRRFKSDFGDHTGRKFFDVLRPATFPVYRDPITMTVKKGMPQRGEMLMTDPDGRRLNMMAWTSPITTATGKLIQVLVVFADVTELRKLQENLASIGLMVSSISHNLKGSITGLVAGTYLIESGFYRDKPGRIEEGLDVVKMMTEKVRKLVNDILYYTKERDLSLEEIDILQFVSEVAANIDTKIRGAGIEFKREFEPDMGTFTVEPGLLRTAFVSILENALEACIDDTSKAAYVIEFTARTDGDNVLFEISDNGMGIKKESLKHLFDLFFSLKGSKGTGLGLFITKKVIQKHGGNLSVESEPGLGTRFQVSVPRRQK